MSKFSSIPACDRPRERLLAKGVENLTHEELLAILFQTGYSGVSVLELANQVLQAHPIPELPTVNLNDLLRIKGVTPTKACTLLAALELSNRAFKRLSNSQPVIDSAQTSVDQLPELRTKRREECHALYCNARHQLLAHELISAGTLASTVIHPRDVLEPALRHNASGLVLAHNHPSGLAEPSTEDLLLTQRMIAACRLLGLTLLDHIIITKTDFCSLRQRGIITSP